MTKKIVKSILSILMIVGFVWLCQAVKFGWHGWTTLNPDYPRDPEGKIQTECKDGTYYDTDLWNCISIKPKEEDTIIIRLLGVFWLDNSRNKDLKFIDYVRAIINIALWLVTFIALIMSIYTFYLMFFTENEAWIKKAKWNLVGIFIALAIIWLAWLIVSFIFRRYQKERKENEETIWNTAINASFNYIHETDNNLIYLNTLG